MIDLRDPNQLVERVASLERRARRAPVFEAVPIVLALLVAGWLLLGISPVDLRASAVRDPLLTCGLAMLLVVVAAVTYFAVRAAYRIADEGEELHLRAQHLVRRLEEKID